MSGLRISIFDSTYIQVAVLAIRAANKDLQAEIRKYTKSELAPVWSEELHANASTKLESYAIAETARVTVSNQNVRLSAGTVNAHLSGGMDVKTDIAAVEFGADRSTVSKFTGKSKRGKPYEVIRHNHRQFRPVNTHGYLFYQTAARMIPRFASLWVQTAMKTIADAIDEAGKK